jgi:hypothetical protein
LPGLCPAPSGPCGGLFRVSSQRGNAPPQERRPCTTKPAST